MNCRFCGNFVPDGKDSCPVCGRRPEEEPIGKLLSENQPGAAAKVEEEEKDTSANKRHPKGIIAPLVPIAAGVIGWIYALLGESADKFRTMLSVITGQSTGLDSESSYVSGSPNAAEIEGVTLYIIIAAIITVIGVAGVIWLLKRLYNNIKYRD